MEPDRSEMIVLNMTDETKTWTGTSMHDMYEGLGPYSFSVSPVSPSKYHSVLYEIPADLSSVPRPHRSQQTHHWDDDHVKMPYSDHNLFPTKDENGTPVLRSRWEVINQVLSQQIHNSEEFELSVSRYNTHLPQFSALHHFFNEVLSEEESLVFFETVLPEVIRLALRLPEIIPGNLLLLKKQTSCSVSLSQLQVSCLLANGFLCTFPWRKDVSFTYPGINFVWLFSSHQRLKRVSCIAEKIKCIIHYFRRVLTKVPLGTITFKRKIVQSNQMPRWDRLENNLGNTRVHISALGTIEDDGHGLLQVDFANKFVGGGVLGYGCVQEEIRFVICPELIAARLFTEELGPNEALIVTGVERYSKYSGYGDTFKWDGDYVDKTPHDEFARRRTSVVALDATKFNRPTDQFGPSSMLRELNKAYVGFHSRYKGKLSPVATGNWGCGAFHGDPRLKFLLQLMACSAANRNMVYYTFNDLQLCHTIHEIYTFVAANRITIVQMWKLLCRFSVAQVKPDRFFPYVQQAYFDMKNPTSDVKATKDEPHVKKGNFKFRFTTKHNTNSYGNTPSTSSKGNPSAAEQSIIEIEDIVASSYSNVIHVDDDVVESSQNVETPTAEGQIRKQQNDLINFINVIDNRAGNSSANNNVNDSTKLPKTEENMRETGNNVIDLNDSCLMEVDGGNVEEKVIAVQTPSGSNVKVKSKITDYFSNVNK